MFKQVLRSLAHVPRSAKPAARRWYSSSTKSASTTTSTNLALTVGLTLGGSLAGYYFAQASQASSGPLKSTTSLADLKPLKYAEGESLKRGFQEIEALMKDDFTRSPSELEYHSDSYFNVHKANPDEKPKLIVYPHSTEQVSEIMKICNKYKIPIVPFSGGTSLEGQYISTIPGIVIDFSKMNQILQLNASDLDVSVQAGVGWQELDEFLKPHNLLFGPDPGPGGMIGGMIGTSCSGTQAFRYGTMKEAVLNLTVVLADGTILKTKQRSKKSAAGYNLTGLFIGSEGTLGVVTEATLKLHARPNVESVIVVNFETVKEATKTVEQLLINGSSLNAIELLDSNMMKCINAAGQTTRQWLNKPTILFKVGGSNQAIVNENIKLVKNVTKENNAISFQFATTEEEKFELWQARKLALFSTMDYGKQVLGQDAKLWITDVAVPISKLSELIADTRRDLNQYEGKDGCVFSTCLGHVGDGNFHSCIMYKPEAHGIVQALTSRMVNKALEYEGTCTGEHGVGLGKRHYLVKEVGENSIDLMRQLKLSLDPYGLLNSGKVFKMDINDKHP
ncbi:hypothetical protein DASC09_005340 [Saccharomycopsis crataegensis]|uniref:D-lactate dehydrogenase (cytochrome) n=1 Tax=Saccharomycopsis crataegensis TaxID=43959 RepID=A0AAV5QFU3_9ASCO|nr:hypothetical protein DASC09_005340 [Saccharomycopsis crataegensis]